MAIPLLVVSDAPNLPSGLARITRDLCHGITQTLSESFDLAVLGWDWADYKPFPWPVHRIRDTDNWGRADLPEVWWRCFGKRRGVVLTVWDPARCFALLEDAADVPAQLWGYFPLDGVNISGGLGGPAAAAIRRYRRVLGYGEFGAGILQSVLGGGNVAWLPHGLDLGVFRPRRASEGLVGVVATNTPRKDWGLAFQAFAKMREAMPKLRLWAHISKEITQSWAIPELADQIGLGGNDLIVTGCEGKDGSLGTLEDEVLANFYSACVVTLGIGMGEGWGYPIAESLACGRPVVHCDYAGGAELVPKAEWRVKERIMHVESAYALKRPILDPGEFADAAFSAADWVMREPEVASAFCSGAVRHLGWDRLWPRWEAWFRQGLRELE